MSDPRGKEQRDNADGTAVVPAAERTLRIFEAFQRCLQPLTLSKLAAEIEAPISSCHNLVRTLTSRGYLFSLESQRTFYPTRKLWELANSIAIHDPVLARIVGAAEELRDATRETIIVGKRQGHVALYLYVLEGPQTIRYVAQPGRTIPLHTSAIGKALLGTLDDKELDSWLNSRPLKRVTANSKVDCARLGVEIRGGRALGYQMTAGENVPDVGAIGMPVRVGGEMMAIAIAGPTERILSNRASLVEALRRSVERLPSSVG